MDKPFVPPPIALSLAVAVALAMLLQPTLLHHRIALPTLAHLGWLAAPLALAGAAWRLLLTLETPYPTRWAVVVLALPTTILAGGLPIMSAAACLIALAAALRREHAAMLLCYGLALALAPQAMLLTPFFASILIARRVPPASWLLASAILVAALVAQAWRSVDPLTVSHGAPNVWLLAQRLFPADGPRLVGLAIASAVGASACYVAQVSARLPAGARIVPVALLATLVTAGLLPNLDERAFLLAGPIALVWAIVSRERCAWQAALLIQAGSSFAICWPDAGALGFACIAVATWLIAMPVIQPAANDNPLRMRPVRLT